MFGKLLSVLGFDTKTEQSPSPEEEPSSRQSSEQTAGILQTAQAGERARTDCCVCHWPLTFPEPIEAGACMECPRCRIRNVITKTGRTNRPERLEIYEWYNGDPYNRSKIGLIGVLLASVNAELKELRDRRRQNLVDLRNYKRYCAHICQRRDKILAELNRQKHAELIWLLAEENIIRKKLGIKDTRSDKSISSSKIEL